MERMPQTPPVPQPRVPVTPAAPGSNVVTPGVFSKQDITALRARGEELSNQLNSAASRRRATRDGLRFATGADKVGLEQRIVVLDARIARLETDIDENGKMLSSLPASRVATAGHAFGSSNMNMSRIADNIVPLAAMFTLFVLAPLALSISRFFWKRSSAPRQVAQSPANAQRLERMEQAIDSIAIEMERVSEGQRFMTRLLSEGRAGVPHVEGQRGQPIGVPVAEKSVAPRY